MNPLENNVINLFRAWEPHSDDRRANHESEASRPRKHLWRNYPKMHSL
jgi:hypothetical protein